MDHRTTLVRAIALAHDLPADPIREIIDAGSVNHVFVLGRDADAWVLRFARDARRTNEFLAEQWCATQAATWGVPTPQVLAAGSLDGLDYGIQRFVAGPRAETVAGDHWSTLAQFARLIARVQPSTEAPDSLFSRFGRDLATAWTAHLDYNLDQLDDGDPLLVSGALTKLQQHRLRDRIAALRTVPMEFGLSHGDLAPRNLLLPDLGRPHLVDWGSASFGPVPWTDLAVLERARRLTGRPTAADLCTFARGWGAPEDRTHRRLLDAYVELTSLDLLRWSLVRRRDLVENYVRDLRVVLG